MSQVRCKIDTVHQPTEQMITVKGRVMNSRGHAQTMFFDVRDDSGILQVCVFADSDIAAIAQSVKTHSVIEVTGQIVPRAEKYYNPKLATGTVEMQAHDLKVLSEPGDLPYVLQDQDSVDVGLRLSHRAYDLRSEKLQQNIRQRSKVTSRVRRYLEDQGFLELETPVLTRSTPEGARDFLVPSFAHPGKMYGLPQSPQLYKQLYMMADFEKYYQIARCFRDEAGRSDRQPEFTQIDLEMSYVDEADVRDVAEGLIRDLFAHHLGVEFGEIPHMSFHEAMTKYGSDKPDLRYSWHIHDLTELLGEIKIGPYQTDRAEGRKAHALAVDFHLESKAKAQEVLSTMQGWKAQAPVFVMKTDQGYVASAKEQALGITSYAEIFAALPDTTRMVFLTSGPDSLSHLGLLRQLLIEQYAPPSDIDWAPLWLVDVPLLEYNAEEDRWDSLHHPFTSPTEKTRHLLKTDPGSVMAKAYDFVLNGYELGGGSIRIHDSQLQREIFSVLGISQEEAEAKFDFLLRHLDLAPPPHGGLAFGLDRILMLMSGEKTIREVIAFPKAQSHFDPLTGAPAQVDTAQLTDVGLKYEKESHD